MFWKLFQKINIALYTILGSKRSSQLITSPIGKIVFALLFKGKGNRVYETHEGIKLEMSPEEAMSLGVALLGSHNHYEEKALKTILHHGDVVIDVGAFIGEESLLAAKFVGNIGRVYAFEPLPFHIRRLADNIKRNHFHNIEIVTYALSNKKGTFPLYEAGSGSSFVKNEAEYHVKKENIKPILVKTITLNDFVKKRNIKRIKLLKIDVEGWDLQVLKGADTILKRKDAPDIMIEVIDSVLSKAGSSASELLAYLKHFGYTPFMFTNSGLVPYQNAQTARTPNLLFRKR